MLIRSAFWIGRPKAGAEARFRTLLEGELFPEMRVLPGVSQVLVLWPDAREDDPPDIFCQIVVMFEDAPALERMLGSPERKALRVKVLGLLDMFDGEMSHINFQVFTPDTVSSS